MLKTIDLIKGVREEYIPMLKQVNIPDFHKCIAQLSGLSINEVSDNMIKNYLVTWAEHKLPLFKMLDNKLRKEIPFSYNQVRDSIFNEVYELGKEFPGYGPWLENCGCFAENKMQKKNLNFRFKSNIEEFLPNFKYEEITLTHFFKSKLKAPDELVTKLAKIFENDSIDANLTISINPVDMMLASENPYNWQSCYRLETPNECSHADGCLAAVLDRASLITYIWNKEGKYTLYDTYSFKSIRYMRMRMWIALSENMTSIHFNDVYPYRFDEGHPLFKRMREEIESFVADYIGVENKWRKVRDMEKRGDCNRAFSYGYSEFGYQGMWIQKDAQPEDIYVYDTEIKCACGCEEIIEGSYIHDEDDYDGMGFKHDCYNYCEEEDNEYCEYKEDYCEDYWCCDVDTCPHYKMHHPECPFDKQECEEGVNIYSENGKVIACKEECGDCPRYKEKIKKEEDKEA